MGVGRGTGAFLQLLRHAKLAPLCRLLPRLRPLPKTSSLFLRLPLTSLSSVVAGEKNRILGLMRRARRGN